MYTYSICRPFQGYGVHRDMYHPMAFHYTMSCLQIYQEARLLGQSIPTFIKDGTLKFDVLDNEWSLKICNLYSSFGYGTHSSQVKIY